MKKPSVIIGKRQIVLSCLTAMLAIAVYINYSMSQSQPVTPVGELTEHRSFGETEFVSAPPAAADPVADVAEVAEVDPAADYFAQARLNKTVSSVE